MNQMRLRVGALGMDLKDIMPIVAERFIKTNKKYSSMSNTEFSEAINKPPQLLTSKKARILETANEVVAELEKERGEAV